MKRSILPCKNRKPAREYKASLARAARRRIRLALKNTDPESSCRLIEREHRASRTSMVWYRRGADKLGPFLHWANARTKDCDSKKEQYDKLRSFFKSDNVISEHALGHFYDPVWDDRHWQNPKRPENIGPFANRQKLTRLLEQAIEIDHKGLNRTLKTLSCRLCRNPLYKLGANHPGQPCPQRCVLNTPKDIPRIVEYLYQKHPNKTGGFSPQDFDLLAAFFKKRGLFWIWAYAYSRFMTTSLGSLCSQSALISCAWSPE